MKLKVFVVAAMLAGAPAFADGPPPPHQHAAGEDWIQKGGLRNAAGEWCCGEGDCALMSPGSVTSTAHGFALHGVGTISQGEASRFERYDELVPEREAQPSIDGRYWRCKRPDGSRRCFFAPPPSS